MTGKVVAFGAVALVAAGAAVALGVAPVFGTTGGTDIGTFPTETPDGGGSAGEADTGPAFAFTVDSVERCGRTCRDVTTTLTNDGDAAASNVTVYTRIYAGNGTDGDVVWEGRRDVGDLSAAQSRTGTERVSLSLTNALAVERNGGWITVRTTVHSDGETTTNTRRRNVA